MGLGCKPIGRLQSIFRKLENEQAKAAAANKKAKEKLNVKEDKD